MFALLILIGLAPASVVAAYHFALGTLGWRPARAPLGEPHTHFVVLIPAHNEQAGLAAAIDSARESDYPPGLVGVLVVADNCDDATATVAESRGAVVIARFDPAHAGKGHALAWVLARLPACDAVLILDADCRLDSLALWHLAAALESGAAAVQARVLADADGTAAGVVAAVGSEVESAVQMGYARLKCGVWLRGTGMAFSRELLDRFPWGEVGLAEDAQYGSRLAAAGVTVTGVPGAVVRTGSPPGVAELLRQRARWRAALFAGARPIDRLMQSKPLLVAHFAATLAAATLLAALAGWPKWQVAAATIWPTLTVALTAAVALRALARRGAVRLAIAQSAGLPGVALRLLGVALGLRARPSRWERAAR